MFESISDKVLVEFYKVAQDVSNVILPVGAVGLGILVIFMGVKIAKRIIKICTEDPYGSD